MIKRDLIEQLKSLGMLHHWEQIKAVSRSCVRLQVLPESEENIPVGNSKMGGKPDLPAGYGWPTEQAAEKPLSFIAQINLAEIAAFDEQGLLPRQGILYFFYSAEQAAWGYDSQDKDKFKVLYYEGSGSELHGSSFPNALKGDARFEPCVLVPQLEISLPSSWDSELLDFLTEDEQESLYELEESSINKMLGYADNIQGAMELECELVTNGIYCGDSSGYASAQAKELEPNAVDWRLLLQVDSNEEECKMAWGDGGRLYFWIKDQELKARNFDACWVILQCY